MSSLEEQTRDILLHVVGTGDGGLGGGGAGSALEETEPGNGPRAQVPATPSPVTVMASEKCNRSVGRRGQHDGFADRVSGTWEVMKERHEWGRSKDPWTTRPPPVPLVHVSNTLIPLYCILQYNPATSYFILL